MASVPAKFLNMENIIRKVFDHTTDTLRTSTSSGPASIIISSVDDSIAIGNVAGDLMTINPNGSTNVNIVGVIPVGGKIPVDLGGATVNITGNVSISNEVEITNDAGNPVPITGTIALDSASLTALENININNFPSSQNVVVTSSALPTNAATSALQITANSYLSSIDSKLTSPLATTVSGVSTLSEQQAQTIRLASIEALNTTMDTTLLNIETEVQSLNSSIDVNLSTVANQTTLAAVDTKIAATNTKLDNLLTELQLKADLTETQPVSISGVATSALQSAGNASLVSIDNKLTSPIAVTSSALTDAELRASSVAVSLASTTISNFPSVQAVSATALPLPTGAATEITLSSVNTKLPSGLTVKAASTPAVAADQALVVTLSPNNPVTATISNASIEISNDVGNPIPINGTVTANIGTTNGLALDSSVNSLLKPSSTLAAVTSITNTVLVKADTLVNQTNALKVDGSAVTQPVSGSVTATISGTPNVNVTNASIPVTGTFFQATQPISIASSVAVTGPLTDTQLRAAAVPVSLTSTTISNFPVTQAVSASTLPLPSGASTSALQTTGNTSLSSIDTKLPSGLTVTAGKLQVQLPAGGSGLTDTELRASAVPVSMASTTITGSVAVTGPLTDTQLRASAVPVSLASTTVTNFPATQAVSAASLPLPTGAATETTLAALNTKAIKDSDSVSGTITALNGFVSMSVAGFGVVAVSITGTWTATMTYQVSADNVNWVNISASSGGGIGSGISTNRSDVQCNVAGFLFFRIIALSFTSGTANVILSTAKGVGPQKVYLDNTVAQFVNANMKDGAGNNITSQVNGTQRALDIGINVAGVQVDPRAVRALTSSDTVTIVQPTGTNLHTVVDSSALPAGAATETTLAALNTSQTNGTQKSQIVDSANNPIDSILATTGVRALDVAMSATNYMLSTVNSTTTQLNAAATFTGTIETIFNQQIASVLLTSDQNGTLTLRQYIDAGGTRKTNDWVYPIVANVPFSRSFPVNGNFFNLLFTNGGGVATTTLSINTAYGTLAAATNLGNGPVSIDEVNGTSFSLGTKLSSLSLPVTLAENARYKASAQGIASAATATDVFTITGSATKTIRITSLIVTGTQTTLGTVPFDLVVRSSTNTGGTSVSRTKVPLDSTSAAATATVRSYTANPTAGTLVGSVNSIRKIIPGAASAVENVPIEMINTPIILRSPSEVLAVNLNSTTVTGGLFSYTITFEEV